MAEAAVCPQLWAACRAVHSACRQALWRKGVEGWNARVESDRSRDSGSSRDADGDRDRGCGRNGVGSRGDPRTGVGLRWTTALLDVVLPVQCVGCGTWDVRLCPGCAALASGPADWGVLEGPTRGRDLGVWTLGEYADRLRGIVLAAKHRPAVDLGVFLVEAGRTLAQGIVAAGVLGRVSETWVVAAPSGWRRRHRGQLVAPVLARGVAQGIAEGTGGISRVVDVAGLRPFTGSQSGRSGGERRSGRLDSMVGRVRVPGDVAVVLADDVVTTGATLRELARVCGPGTVAAAALCRVGGPGKGESDSRSV